MPIRSPDRIGVANGNGWFSGVRESPLEVQIRESANNRSRRPATGCRRTTDRRSEQRNDLFDEAGHLLVGLLVRIAEQVRKDRQVLEAEQVAVEGDALGDLVRGPEEDRLLVDRLVERGDEAGS